MHFLLLLPLLAALSAPAPGANADDASIAADLHAFIGDAPLEKIVQAHLDATAHALAKRLAGLGASARQIEAALHLQVAKNLREKRALSLNGHSFPLTAREINSEVIDYESFKLDAYVRSGVFPKRYFGYLDGKWDTATYEATLIRTAHGAAATANAYLAAQGAKVRVTEQEIAVTFLAEGGAILLREQQARLDDIPPVQGIGLDDIATGFRLYPDLIAALDAQFGTALHSVVAQVDGKPVLARNFKYAEAILGTAVMWTYEKERCERLLAEQHRPGLETRDLDTQFILSSLVYNSGILFDDARIGEIRGFQTAEYLARISEKMKSKRWLLPVHKPAPALKALLQTGDYPEQPTSWSAVYHVLQRFGAYTALLRCTDLFDAHGAFRSVPAATEIRPR